MNSTQFHRYTLGEEIEETIIEITTTAPNQTFDWNTVVGSIKHFDWGDGVRNNSKRHTFANEGSYRIKIVGEITELNIGSADKNNHLPTKIIKVASTITNFMYCFAGFTNITSIPNGLFDRNVNATIFTSCFSGCINLTSIPSGLFDKNVNAVYFGYCFYNCSNLITVPIDLFDKNVNAIAFTGCFHNNTKLINRPKPHGLEMWQIAGTNGRPATIYISGMFRYCKSIPDYNSLPASVK